MFCKSVVDLHTKVSGASQIGSNFVVFTDVFAKMRPCQRLALPTTVGALLTTGNHGSTPANGAEFIANCQLANDGACFVKN